MLSDSSLLPQEKERLQHDEIKSAKLKSFVKYSI